ncbi:MAG: hypothetical protein ACOC4E_02555 [Patescibacteria group bacterium]
MPRLKIDSSHIQLSVDEASAADASTYRVVCDDLVTSTTAVVHFSSANNGCVILQVRWCSKGGGDISGDLVVDPSGQDHFADDAGLVRTEGAADATGNALDAFVSN